MEDVRHRCDGRCVCPAHGTPLIYWPLGDEHACQDVNCKHGHGGLFLAGAGWLSLTPKSRERQ